MNQLNLHDKIKTDSIQASVKLQNILNALSFASMELEFLGSSNELMILDDARDALKEMKQRADDFLRGVND